MQITPAIIQIIYKFLARVHVRLSSSTFSKTCNWLLKKTTDKGLNIHTFTGQCAQYLSGRGEGQVGGFCEDDNELSGYIKYGEFLKRSATTSFSRMALLHGGKSHFMPSNKFS